MKRLVLGGLLNTATGDAETVGLTAAAAAELADATLQIMQPMISAKTSTTATTLMIMAIVESGK